MRYLLFADEATLPESGIQGDPRLLAEFGDRAIPASNGLSLRDFDLQTRMFKHRCSYMIYSKPFQGLPKEFKAGVYRKIGQALSIKTPQPEFSYIPTAEKRAILQILRETLEW